MKNIKYLIMFCFVMVFISCKSQLDYNAFEQTYNSEFIDSVSIGSFHYSSNDIIYLLDGIKRIVKRKDKINIEDYQGDIPTPEEIINIQKKYVNDSGVYDSTEQYYIDLLYSSLIYKLESVCFFYDSTNLKMELSTIISVCNKTDKDIELVTFYMTIKNTDGIAIDTNIYVAGTGLIKKDSCYMYDGFSKLIINVDTMPKLTQFTLDFKTIDLSFMDKRKIFSFKDLEDYKSQTVQVKY